MPGLVSSIINRFVSAEVRITVRAVMVDFLARSTKIWDETEGRAEKAKDHSCKMCA